MESLDESSHNTTIKKICRTVFETPSNTLAIFFLVFGFLDLLLDLSGIKFYPASALAYDIIFTAIIIWLTARRFIREAESNRVSSVLSALLPLFAAFYIIINDAAIGRETDYSYIIHALAAIVCSEVIFFFFKRGKARKIIFGIINTTLLIVISFLLFIALMFADFGLKTVISTHVSPNSTYIAEIIEDNQGALGGATLVTVTRHMRIRNLLIGKLTKTIYKGRYGEFENMILRWETDRILYVNDQRYSVFVP